MLKLISLSRIFCFAGLCLSGWTCSKTLPGLNTAPPQDQLTADKVFADDRGAEGAMIGYYNDAMNTLGTRGILNGGISVDAGLSPDELDCTAPVPVDDSFRMNTLTPRHVILQGFIVGSYHLLLDLNSVVEGVAGSKGVSLPVKLELTGEAKFHRALIYFYLVNLFGAVPLVVGTDYQVNEATGRTPVETIYVQVVADLRDAASLLPPDYITTPEFAGNRTRPNRLAALALLARVQLYRGQWAAADSAASVVIADGRYRLEPSLDSVFLATSQEAIYQLQPVKSTTATADAQAFLSLKNKPRPPFYLRPELVAAFEAGDARKQHWTKTTTDQGTLYYYPFKYKQSTASPTDPEYEMVLRLAEQYLIRAEAKAQEGDLVGGLSDLNRVRARAGLGPVAAGGLADLLAAIGRERRIELFSEWGHRWLDLRRSGQADAVLGNKVGWRSTDVLWPIPDTLLQASPGMLQNPGY